VRSKHLVTTHAWTFGTVQVEGTVSVRARGSRRSITLPCDVFADRLRALVDTRSRDVDLVEAVR